MDKKLTGQQETFLDLFRILAAFFVVIGHSLSFYQLTIFQDDQYFCYWQEMGVVMLFLLSGFLLAYTTEMKYSSGGYSYKLFVKHRFYRIEKELIPALLFVALIDFIALSLPGNNYQYQEAYNVQQFLANLLFLNGTFPSRIPGIKLIPFGSARPLWTLAIEWWFYMLFGYCFFTIKENKNLNLKRICMLLFLLLMPSEYIISVC